MHRLIRLGWSHFVIVASAILTVLLIWWILLVPTLQELYIRQFALRPIAERYGFEFGVVTFTRDNVWHEWSGFVRVDPDGELARMGVRPRDLLVVRHGNSATALYHALTASERGDTAELEVVNADDWSMPGGQQAFRTIQIHPRTKTR